MTDEGSGALSHGPVPTASATAVGLTRALESGKPADLPTWWRDLAFPAWGTTRLPGYRDALWTRYRDWEKVAQTLREELSRQFPKANGLFAFNAILIALLTFRGALGTKEKIAVSLLVFSSFLLLAIVWSVWGRAKNYKTARTEAMESLWLVGKRSVLHNWAIGFSFPALIMVLVNLWSGPQTPSPAVRSILTFVLKTGSFCRGEATAPCTTDSVAPPTVESQAAAIVEIFAGDSTPPQFLVIGSADRLDLGSVSRSRFGSNEGLARARAAIVAKAIVDRWNTRIRDRKLPPPLELTVGPGIHGPGNTGLSVTSSDRSVTVYAVVGSGRTR